jgi:MFS family permease
LAGLFAFSPRQQPWIARPNYGHELKSAFTFPLAAALAEGTFAGVVAQKYFGAGPFLLAVIVAAPMFGNVLALFWSQLAQRRPLVKFVNALQLGVVACIAAVGLTVFVPEGGDGRPLAVAGWIFAALIVLARVLASGIITVRSSIWRFNYPTGSRAQIVSRITVIYNAILGGGTFAAGLLMDVEPWTYAILYPAIAVVSLLGVRSYSKIRVRGQRKLLREVPTDGGGFRSVVKRMRSDLGILKRDPIFAKYQWCQFVLGASFMSMIPPLIKMVSEEMTDPTSQYALALAVLHLVPMLLGVLAIGVWAPIFDRMSILQFRSWHTLAIIATHGLILAGALVDSLWVVAVGTAMMGISMGGGQLAWQLGQHAFAKPEESAAYMGVHVMLTGLRGMLAPFAGTGVYVILSQLFTIGDLPGGRMTFAMSVLLGIAGLIGYVRLYRRHGRLPNEH